jgi:hypothetical protein
MDVQNLLPGEQWDQVIRKNIRQAEFVLLFMSKNSLSKRGYVQREFKIALHNLEKIPEGKVFIIPVRLDDSQIPYDLSHIHHIDLFKKEGWKLLVDTLRSKIKIDDELRFKVKEQEELKKPQPHIFVAMPFADEMEDIYFYGISRAIDENGFASVRIDKIAFTGEIMKKVQEKIRTATAVVADLTEANPNVYLELGYAWGKGVPTILLVQYSKQLCFDVRGHRCIVYKRIKQLEALLTE